MTPFAEGRENQPKSFSEFKSFAKKAKEFYVGPNDLDWQYLEPTAAKSFGGSIGRV